MHGRSSHLLPCGRQRAILVPTALAAAPHDLTIPIRCAASAVQEAWLDRRADAGQRQRVPRYPRDGCCARAA